MSLKVELSDKVYWLGFNDRRKHLFENQWPLDKGVTYNAYLIDDEKTALIDTAEAPFSGDLVAWIKDLLGAKKLDYLIINHMEPDHSGSIKDVVTAFPEITIVGNRKTFPILEGFYGISKNIYEVAEGDILSLGKHQLQFFMIPMVHWPESMVTYDTTDKIIFSNDAFGSFGTLNGGVFDDEMDLTCFNEEIRRYYSNIVGKYGAQVQSLVDLFTYAFVSPARMKSMKIISSHLVTKSKVEESKKTKRQSYHYPEPVRLELRTGDVRCGKVVPALYFSQAMAASLFSYIQCQEALSTNITIEQLAEYYRLFAEAARGISSKYFGKPSIYDDPKQRHLVAKIISEGNIVKDSLAVFHEFYPKIYRAVFNQSNPDAK